ncbi:MAG: hypothetical protein ACRDOI_16420 [Trebonia sp.]
MIDTDDLIRRNATFADGRSFADLTIRPGGNLRVIGCVDSRVDPSDVLGLTTWPLGSSRQFVPPARVKP